jgi:hypothetical protein
LIHFQRFNLKTFSNLHKKSSVKAADKIVLLKADRNLFARLLVIAQCRKMDIRQLLYHELGPIPWSLAALDGH